MLQIYVGSARDLSAKNNQNTSPKKSKKGETAVHGCNATLSVSVVLVFVYVVSALQFLYSCFSHRKCFQTEVRAVSYICTYVLK